MAAINLGRLECELAAALEADQRYQRENDAKFRAVYQKVASYEEFRDIVKASHLAPLEHKDIVGGAVKQPWNSVAAVSGGQGAAVVDGRTEEGGASKKLPTSSQEFVREWRRLKGTSREQYKLLMMLPGDQLFPMVTVEASMMGGLIAVMKEHYQVEDANKVFTVLRSLSETPRFSLSLDFLAHREREAVQQLFVLLFASRELLIPEHVSQLTSLCQAYKLTFPPS